MTYREAGVDIDAGNRLIERIKPAAARTQRPGSLAGLGGFGALFQVPVERYREPVLVSGTDGVGTKLMLAQRLDRHDDIGIDLVAMCANDVVVQGAEPLFFLDYYATGKLDEDIAARVIEGIARGCEVAGCALMGGETAEMPGLYQPGDYDVAGFCVGIAERGGLIDGSTIRPGDTLIGVASSGPHSNGYSLIRRILERGGADPSAPLAGVSDGTTLGAALLAPTRIYVRPLLTLMGKVTVKGAAHVTGGGLPENVPRALPGGTRAAIDTASWRWPAVFEWLRQAGGVDEAEMYRTFNCGVGLVVCVGADDVEAALESLRASGEAAWPIGRVEAATGDGPRVTLAAGG